MCSSVRPFIYLSVLPSFCHSVQPFVFPPTRLLVHPFSTHPPVGPSVFCPPACRSIRFLSSQLPVRPPNCTSIHLPVGPSVYPSIHPYVCLSVCLSVHLSFSSVLYLVCQNCEACSECPLFNCLPMFQTV